MKKLTMLTAILLMLFTVGCDKKSSNVGSTDQDTSVPTDDPSFTSLTTSWVIDNVGVMDKKVIAKCHKICQNLQDDGMAEMVVLIQNGVKHQSDYATHYGRWLGLGKKGLSTEGGNNGVVWLIRPDAVEKMTYSIGEGLPELVSGYMVDIMNKAKDYLNFNNYDQGVLVLVQETDKKLRELYGKKGVRL